MSVTVEKCLQAWTNSLRQMNARSDVVFFGDSQVYYGDFASVFPDKVVCNLGLRGDTIQGMIDRMVQLRILKPKQVFLMVGINDVANNTANEFKKQFEVLLMQFEERSLSMKLVVFGMLPVNDVDFSIRCNNEQIVRCNEIIASLCNKHGLCYINLFAVYERNGKLPKERTIDGIHLKPEAYYEWYNSLNIYQRI